MAYDTQRGRIVMFGGAGTGLLNDTWEYGPLNMASYEALGTGCAGSSGVPRLASELGSRPWLGGTFTARLDNLGSNGLPFMLLGDSKAQWGTIPLPLELTLIGMAGCSLYTNPIVTYALSNSAGTALWSIPIPGVTAYVGLRLYTQGVVTSPGANPLGVVMSNACEMIVGWK
jgi:hypothetical protein